jgi:hypothetical protein
MIAERLPELAAMSREEKWEVFNELDFELNGQADPQLEDTHTKAAILELLELRLAHYDEHPETARPWSEVRERLQERYVALKASRLKSA